MNEKYIHVYNNLINYTRNKDLYIGLSRKDKGRIDQIAAMIILESYFEQKK